MMKKIIVYSIAALCAISAKAQNYDGYEVSPYGGITSVDLQPASLASTPYKWDINLAAASASGMVKDLLPKNGFNKALYTGDRVQLSSVLTSKSSKFIMYGRISMPSVAYSINEKSGVAFSWRMGAIAYGRSSSSQISLLLSTASQERTLVTIPLIESMAGIVNSWQEFSGSYGRNIYTKGQHRWDLGGAAKYVVGGASASVNVEGLEIAIDETSNTLTKLNGNVSLLYNNSVDDLSEGKTKQIFSGNGYAATIGAVYTFQTKAQQQKILDRPGQANYLLKVSGSLRDFGKIYFKASDHAASYSLKLKKPIDAHYFDQLSSIKDLTQRLDSAFSYSVEEFGNYSLYLPATLNVNVDGQIYKHIYGNVLFDYSAINMRQKLFENQYIANYQFSLRFEKEKYGFYLATNFSDWTGWGSSISARYSVLYVGLSNFIKSAQSEQLRAFGVMFALKIPILHKGQSNKGRIF